MAVGITGDILIMACITWGLCVLLLSRELARPLAVIVTSIKVSLPFLFFSFFNQGQWYMVDDWNYCMTAKDLLKTGYSAFDFVSPFSDITLGSLVGSEHTLYIWWNLLISEYVSEAYYAPVFLNVALSSVAAILANSLLANLNFNPRARTTFTVFLALHWDVLAWSSFVNLKDTMVMTMTIALFLSAEALYYKRSGWAIFPAISLLVLFAQIRHYVPAIFIGSFILWILMRHRQASTVLLVLLLGISSLALLPLGNDDLSYIHVGNIPYGAFRFLLTPLFWTITAPEQGFTDIEAFFHWLFFIPMLFGAWKLCLEHEFNIFLWLYFGCMVLFYAMTPELQGSRQRVQLCFIMALGQIRSIWWLLRFNPLALARNSRLLVRGEIP